MASTRSVPEFAYDPQRELYAARKTFATTTGFPFDAEYEEAAISAMTIDQANTALAMIKEQREKYDSQKKKGKAKTATGDEEKRESSDQGKDKPSENEGSKPSDEPETSSAKKADDESTKPKGIPEPDPRKRTSRKDKESVRGRTPRIETGETSSKRLFKMDPPDKYSGEKDSDRTYAAVHKFLSQLSSYL